MLIDWPWRYQSSCEMFNKSLAHSPSWSPGRAREGDEQGTSGSILSDFVFLLNRELIYGAPCDRPRWQEVTALNKSLPVSTLDQSGANEGLNLSNSLFWKPQKVHGLANRSEITRLGGRGVVGGSLWFVQHLPWRTFHLWCLVLPTKLT